MEIILREVCAQLIHRRWRPVLVYEQDPAPIVRDYFAGLDDVQFLVLPAQAGLPLRHLPAFWNLIGSVRPQLVVYAFNGVLRWLPWIARLRGVSRIVYWDHSSKPIGYVPQPFPLLKRAVARVLTHPVALVTAVAGYTGRCLAVQGLCAEDKIKVAHNGAVLRPELNPEQAAAFRARLGLQPDQELIVQVSWLVPEKGIDVFLQVARQVVSVRPTTKWAIVGEGPRRAEYESLARQLQLQDHVVFTGSVSMPTENGVFEGADIYCQFSQWEEACPAVLLEAQAAGRPIIASRVGGIPELVIDNETGFLVGRQDVAEAARRILQLLENPAQRRSMGQAAWRHAQANFGLGPSVTRLLDLWAATAE